MSRHIFRCSCQPSPWHTQHSCAIKRTCTEKRACCDLSCWFAKLTRTRSRSCSSSKPTAGLPLRCRANILGLLAYIKRFVSAVWCCRSSTSPRGTRVPIFHVTRDVHIRGDTHAVTNTGKRLSWYATSLDRCAETYRAERTSRVFDLTRNLFSSGGAIATGMLSGSKGNGGREDRRFTSCLCQKVVATGCTRLWGVLKWLSALFRLDLGQNMVFRPKWQAGLLQM